MNELLQTVLSTPLANLLIVASLGFLFISVAGSVAGKIEPGPAGRITAGVVGSLLLMLGIGLRVFVAPDGAGAQAPASAALVAETTPAAVASAVIMPPPPAAPAPLPAPAAELVDTAPAPPPRQMARLLGRLLFFDGTARTPLGGARIELHRSGETDAAYETLTDPAGNYVFPGVRPDGYEIRVRSAQDVTLPLVSKRLERVVLLPGGTRRLNFAVQR